MQPRAVTLHARGDEHRLAHLHDRENHQHQHRPRQINSAAGGARKASNSAGMMLQIMPRNGTMLSEPVMMPSTRLF